MSIFYFIKQLCYTDFPPFCLGFVDFIINIIIIINEVCSNKVLWLCG